MGWAGIPFLPLFGLPGLWALSSRITFHDRSNVEPMVRRLPISADEVLAIRVAIRFGLGVFLILFCWLALGGGSTETLELGSDLAWELLYVAWIFHGFATLAILSGPSKLDLPVSTSWEKRDHGVGRAAFFLLAQLGPSSVLFQFVALPDDQMTGWRWLGLYGLFWGTSLVLLPVLYWMVRREHLQTYFGNKAEPLFGEWWEDPPVVHLYLIVMGLLEPTRMFRSVAFVWAILVILYHLRKSRWWPRDTEEPVSSKPADGWSLRFVVSLIAVVTLSLRGSFSEAIAPWHEAAKNAGNFSRAAVPLEALLRFWLFLAIGVFAAGWLLRRIYGWHAQGRLLRRLPIESGAVTKARAWEVLRLLVGTAVALVVTEVLASVLAAPEWPAMLSSQHSQALGLTLGMGLWTGIVLRFFERRNRWWLLPMGLLPAWGMVAALPWLAQQSPALARGFLLAAGLWVAWEALEAISKPVPLAPRT